MAHDLVIRNGQIASSTGLLKGDIAISRGKIAEIGAIGGAAAKEFDARGLIVMPGVIDTQVHFREPGMEHKENIESGTRAAICGGVTSVLEMPNTNPPTTCKEALEDKLRRAQGRAWCHFGFFIGASLENLEELADLEKLPGTPGIKIFAGSSTGSLLVGSEGLQRKALRNGRKRMAVHSEDEARNLERKALLSEAPHPREHPFLRDEESARLSTERLLSLSKETGRPIHILHVSTKDELPLLSEAKRLGINVTCEVTPQHLWFSSGDYERLESLIQQNPPIRSEEHRMALWKALEKGLFDVFGSDHAPHTLDEKSKPYPFSPSGMPGVQTMLPVLLTFAAQGRLSLMKVTEMACEKPAQLYGIQGKGRVQEGFDADITIVDPSKSYVFERKMVQSKCGWSPFEGERLTGTIEAVILGGEVVMREGQLQGDAKGQVLSFA